MHLHHSMTRAWRWRPGPLCGLVIMLAGAGQAMAGGVPVSGMPVPELAVFDQAMCDFMDTNGIPAGVLGIMRNGVIVYQRGFGWKDSDNTVPLRHDAMMRIASLTKPMTAAAVRKLIATTGLSDTDNVFDLGQEGGGILEYTPFGDLADTDYENIQVQHLYMHTSGLPTNDSNDPTYNEVNIAQDMEIGSPPSRYNTVRWIMGNNSLAFTPGNQTLYSNVGFLILGLIVENQTEVDHYTYVRDEIFGPMEWMPLTDIVRGRTFSQLHDPREPYYDGDAMVQNVFDPNGPNVRQPEGGWDHEARIGQGGMVCSTTALLHLAENYYISHGSSDYGLPTGGVRDTLNHTGSLPGGTHTVLRQRSDGVNFAVLFNQRGTDQISNNSYSVAIRDTLDAIITNGGFVWPDQGVDGQWVDFADPDPGDGAFESPWNAMGTAVAASPHEATLNIKPSISDWTGTLSQPLRVRAPLGPVTIGQQ